MSGLSSRPGPLLSHFSYQTPGPPCNTADGIVAGTSTIGFTVTDLDKTYYELRSKNVRFAKEPKLQEEEGIKLAVCLDPDDLEISISETVKQPIRAETPTS